MKKFVVHYRILLLTMGILLSVLFVHSVWAQAPGASSLDLPSPVAAKDVPQLINSMIKGILGVVGALSLLFFVYGGMLWLTSMGNSERINKGKETLIWATIGLVVIFSSYAILNVVINALTK